MIIGRDIFTDRQIKERVYFWDNEIKMAGIIIMTEYQCISIGDNVLILLTPEGQLKEDVDLPREPHLA